MGEVTLRPAENFDQAYGMICEGFCPNCGGGLHRRSGWGYGFCIVQDMGWAAVQGDVRLIHQRVAGRNYRWDDNGTGAFVTDSGMTCFVAPGPLQPWLWRIAD